MSKLLYRESLLNLRTALKAAEPRTVETREAVKALAGDVSAILEHPGDAPFVHHHNLLNNLKSSMAGFEASHPSLYAAVCNVVHALSNMGI